LQNKKCPNLVQSPCPEQALGHSPLTVKNKAKEANNKKKNLILVGKNSKLEKIVRF